LKLQLPPYAVDLDDAGLRVIAKAWPHLKSLELPNRECIAKITLAGLIPFAMHCPDLEQLSIPLRAASQDFPSVEGLSNPKMAVLDVGRSPIEAWEDVTVFIHAIYPKMKSWDGSVRYDPTEYDPREYAER